MKASVIFIFLLFGSMLFPQEKSFRAEIGLNRSWFNYEFELLNEFETEFRPNLTAGLHYNFYSLKNFSFNAGVRYYNLFRYFDMEPYGYRKGSLATFDNYLISVPVQVYYNIDIINISIIANIEPAVIINSTINSPSSRVPFEMEKREVTSEMNRFQVAAGVGIEYDFTISEQKFGIKTIYNFGLTDIPKKGRFTNSAVTYEWAEFKTTEINLFIAYYF